MKIQVLGSGCPTCKKFYDIVQQVLSEMETDLELEYITGVEGTSKILELGVMSSPVLAINNQVAFVGFSADKDKIQQIIAQAIQQK